MEEKVDEDPSILKITFLYCVYFAYNNPVWVLLKRKNPYLPKLHLVSKVHK